jgi:anthranilate synthase component II
MRPTRIFLVDNYDSFTYNLVHLLEQLEVNMEVRRNDAFSLDEVNDFTHIMISPGPGLPKDTGLCPQLIERYGDQKSIFGVCLGMQLLLSRDGAAMTNMPTVQHGMQDTIQCVEECILFNGLPRKIRVGRYHSWAFLPENIPPHYRVTSLGSDGYVMAVEHRTLPLFGVQFHPESIMTEHGLGMVRNWLNA